MTKYVYLIAQLPALAYDKPSYMNVSMFLEEANKWMSKRDLEKLKNVSFKDSEVDEKHSKTLRIVQQFGKQIRQDLGQWRQSKKKGAEYKPESFPVSIVKEGNPLEIEKKLLYLRWQFIESMELDHHFDLDLLMLYFLKLQILQKLSEYNKDKGMERFQQISKVIE
ncbi:DUF2764 family protein [bacterium]